MSNLSMVDTMTTMILLILKMKATRIRLNVARSRLEYLKDGIPEYLQRGTMMWQCQELMLRFADLLSPPAKPAGPETGVDPVDGSVCNGYDSGDRAHSVFISDPKSTPLCERTCTTCRRVTAVYETPFGLQCQTCANIDIADRNQEKGT